MSAVKAIKIPATADQLNTAVRKYGNPGAELEYESVASAALGDADAVLIGIEELRNGSTEMTYAAVQPFPYPGPKEVRPQDTAETSSNEIRLAEFNLRTPAGWLVVSDTEETVGFSHPCGLKVFVTFTEADGKPWVSIAASRKKNPPTLYDMEKIRAEFLGPNKWAIMVFAGNDDRARYGLAKPGAENVRHLLYCPTGETLFPLVRA
jgi:hypothetical protein